LKLHLPYSVTWFSLCFVGQSRADRFFIDALHF